MATLRRVGPPIVLVALFYTVSLQPTVPVPAVVGLDKVLHASAYGVLGILIRRAHGTDASATALATGAMLGIVAGIVDEWIQSGTPGRTATATDALADAVGVILGMTWWGVVTTASAANDRT